MDISETETSTVELRETALAVSSLPDNMPNRELESFMVGEPSSENRIDSVSGVSTMRGASSVAPLFSFDEDGDILQCERPFTPHNSVESEIEKSHERECVRHMNENLRDLPSDPSKNGEILENGSPLDSPAPATRRRKIGVMKSQSKNSTDGGSAQQQHQKEAMPSSDSASSPEVALTSAATPQVNIVLQDTPPSIPKIDFQAPSIEVVEDYLEDHLEGHPEQESQLRDLYTSLLGDSGSYVSLLSAAAPQETSAAPKRQRVPFDTVVFTERKPSTGDALIQSLGLSADGADTIQDIASKNQGAARGRLQFAEGGQCEAVGLTKQCESCGVSPEDCLKRLGLHSERERILSPSPKCEKLWQLLHQIQAAGFTQSKNRRPSGSEPELDIDRPDEDTSVAPTKSRSLDGSPLNSPLSSHRKPMLHTV